MEDILYGVAVAHGLIDYERLAHRVGLQANHMTHLLAEVPERSALEGEPMWTALCVSAQTDRPHAQFHQLCRTAGITSTGGADGTKPSKGPIETPGHFTT